MPSNDEQHENEAPERERPDTKSPPPSPPRDQQDVERGEDKLDSVIPK